MGDTAVSPLRGVNSVFYDTEAIEEQRVGKDVGSAYSDKAPKSFNMIIRVDVMAAKFIWAASHPLLFRLARYGFK